MSERVWSGYQTAVFEDFATGKGHTVIQAVAGSGKTTTVIEALKHLPTGKRTVMLAFNKSTAEELKRRVPAGVDAKTSHGLGYGAVLWAWQSLVGKVNVDDKREMKISRQISPKWDMADHSAVCKLVSFAKAWATHSETNLVKLAREYDVRSSAVSQTELVAKAHEIMLRSQQPSETISFDDMVYLPVALGLKPRQYDVVVVDETQDLNRAQVELALMACRRGGRIIAVGDSSQAIYGFRGADSRSMTNLVTRLKAKTLPLSVTYRCPKAVVEIAQEVVPHLEAAPDAEQGEVVEEVTAKHMVEHWTPGDFVISRTNAPLVRLCLRALRDGVPAFVLGRDVGAGVRALVEKYHGQSVSGLLAFTQQWLDEESARLRAMDKADKIDAAQDRVDTVAALADGCGTVAELLGRIDSLFSDDKHARRLMFSSIHRIKGAETERVWLLERTLRRGANQEEDNLFYVAVTRARQTLQMVEWDPKTDKL